MILEEQGGKKVEFGTIRIRLGEVMAEKNVSKYKLGFDARMQSRQITAYCDNVMSKVDLDILGRLCTVLDCEVGDLLEFVPPKE